MKIVLIEDIKCEIAVEKKGKEKSKKVKVNYG